MKSLICSMTLWLAASLCCLESCHQVAEPSQPVPKQVTNAPVSGEWIVSGAGLQWKSLEGNRVLINPQGAFFDVPERADCAVLRSGSTSIFGVDNLFLVRGPEHDETVEVDFAVCESFVDRLGGGVVVVSGDLSRVFEISVNGVEEVSSRVLLVRSEGIVLDAAPQIEVWVESSRQKLMIPSECANLVDAGFSRKSISWIRCGASIGRSDKQLYVMRDAHWVRIGAVERFESAPIEGAFAYCAEGEWHGVDRAGRPSWAVKYPCDSQSHLYVDPSGERLVLRGEKESGELSARGQTKIFDFALTQHEISSRTSADGIYAGRKFLKWGAKKAAALNSISELPALTDVLWRPAGAYSAALVADVVQFFRDGKLVGESPRGKNSLDDTAVRIFWTPSDKWGCVLEKSEPICVQVTDWSRRKFRVERVASKNRLLTVNRPFF
ncbi:MAG: hypothetical protein MK135_10665 [Polyangiaceae bacterium]|nr:hypothetical protein [Polyangiaceae bacterium]